MRNIIKSMNSKRERPDTRSIDNSTVVGDGTILLDKSTKQNPLEEAGTGQDSFRRQVKNGSKTPTQKFMHGFESNLSNPDSQISKREVVSRSVINFNKIGSISPGLVAEQFNGINDDPNELAIDKCNIAPDSAPNKDSYCKMPIQSINSPELLLFDVKNSRLQYIFNEERDEYEQAIEDIRRNIDSKSFRYEVLLSFWLCIYLEKPYFAQIVHELDPVVEKVLVNLQKQLGPTASMKKRPIKKGQKTSDSDIGVSEKLLNLRGGQLNFNTEQDLKEIKELLKTQVGITFNTNVMRIALNLGEEKIASILIADYVVKIDEEMVNRAIKTAQLDFLYCMFAYNRNFQELLQPQQEFQGDDNGERYRVFTLDYVFQSLLEFVEPDKGNTPQSLIRQMANWKIRSTENILKSLLKNHVDTIANEVALFYIENADWKLLKFAIENCNEQFLKYSLQNQIISQLVMTTPQVIDMLLDYFRKGTRTELLLNVLLFSNLTFWEQTRLRSFLDMLKEMVSVKQQDLNRILLCYNSVLSIALAGEFLDKIASSQNIFRHECNIVKESLLRLGQFIIDNIEDEKIEQVFLDTDFKDRTTLKIATVNLFQPLCASDKVSVLLDEIWSGKRSFECDGQWSDFSIISFLATSRIKKVKGKRLTFKQFVNQDFSEQIEDQNYSFQYKFRYHSIAYLYQKDFFFALGIVILFQYLNFQYLRLFRLDAFANFTDDAQYVVAQYQIEEYQSVNYFGTIFSVALVLHLISKLIFNVFADVKIPLDKWTIIDIFCAFFNLICFNVIGNASAETIIDRQKKQTLDYYVIIVVIVSWLRFFGYFLIHRTISKLLNTLIKMLIDAFSFIVIVSCYFLIMGTIFTMLFQDVEDMVDPWDGNLAYGDISHSIRTLFYAMMGNYQFTQYSNFSTSNSILTVFHVFTANIFLINFLVAILSTTYDIMINYGEFTYKCNQYEFIEKYSIALNDPNGYSELVIHPPPINIFTLTMIPAVFVPSIMKILSVGFSKFIFWVENIAYIAFFIIYELLLSPLIYFKVSVQIGFLATWLTIVPMLLFWTMFGPLILMYHISHDVFFLIKLLCDYMDEKDQFKQKEEDNFKQDKIVIYNEIIEIMRTVAYLFRQKLFQARQKRESLGEELEGVDKNEQELFALEGQNPNALQEKSKVSLMMDKSLIVEAWARYRPGSNNQEVDEESEDLQNRSIVEILGGPFMKKMLMGVRQKYQLTKEQLASGKEVEKNSQKKIQEFLNDVLENEGRINEEDGGLEDLLDGDQAQVFHDVPEEEIQLIEDFLDKFVFMNDSSTSGREQVDLNLALKSLPLKVSDSNLYRIDLMNFGILQKSLISFQNDQQDELFVYYDNRNRQRLQKITQRASVNETQSEEIKNLADLCHTSFSRLTKMLGTQVITNTSAAPPSQEENRKSSAFSKVVPI